MEQPIAIPVWYPGLTHQQLVDDPIEVELGETSLAALENITVNVETSGGLTNAELRASPVTVEPLGKVGAARKIASSTISSRVTLTAGCKRISIRARGCDMRYAVGDSSVTANASTSHFIAQDERMDIGVNSGSSIAAIREALAVVDGTLEISELE